MVSVDSSDICSFPNNSSEKKVRSSNFYLGVLGCDSASMRNRIPTFDT